ncbi:MAG: CorA family divalent cation transporter [Gemmatimonadaceae bacterium]
MRLVVDASEKDEPTEVSADRLGELLAVRENRLWLDISDPGPTEVALLRREFGFHKLALEEMTRPHERPRCNAYGSYYFIVVYAAEHRKGVLAVRVEPLLGRELSGDHPSQTRGRAGRA